MAIKINAKECCGDHCKIEDAHEFNTSSVEEEIREESCRCSDEWQEDE